MALQTGRGFLNEHVKNITPEDLYEAILKNKDLWNNMNKNVKEKGIKIIKKFRGVFRSFYKDIDVNIILEWLKQDRPDLYSVIINTDNGIEWLNNQVENIKKGLILEI